MTGSQKMMFWVFFFSYLTAAKGAAMDGAAPPLGPVETGDVRCSLEGEGK